MSTYRARASCPICSEPEEVWFLKGKIEPLDVVECNKCRHIYEPADFIASFHDLYQNSTISSSFIVMNATV